MPYKILDQAAQQGSLEVSGIPPNENVSTVTDESSRPLVAFLMRRHPGRFGGVQRQSSLLIKGLSRDFCLSRLIWRGPAWSLPLSYLFLYRQAARNGARVLCCDDAVTSLVGARIRSRTAMKVVGVVHGLDVVLPIPWYQRRLRTALRSIDKVICVSRATAAQVQARGVENGRIEVIPNPAEDVVGFDRKSEATYREVGQLLGCDFREKKVLLSIGRPIRRKGFDSFISNVFPHLPDDYVYIVAGPKPETPVWLNGIGRMLGRKYHHLLLLAFGCDSIHDSLMKLSSRPRVFYVNGVSDRVRDMLYSIADLFIMPNRTVEGDMEGFGIVALEAAMRGVSVVATGIEGITDAVIDGENGYCAAEGDFEGMARMINSITDDPAALASFGRKAREFTKKRFALEIIVSRYKKVFEELLNDEERSSRA